MNLAKLLIIDDDPDYLSLLEEALCDNFIVQCASNLNTADELLSRSPPFDIALVDERIGTDSGTQWIKRHHRDVKAATSFVLYSGLVTEQAVLRGLECGAVDFLAKPMSILTLNRKLKNLIGYHHQIHKFQDELISKDRVINISMAQASKYGSCMQLTGKLNFCHTVEQLRDKIFGFMYDMNLYGCLAFYPLNQTPVYFNAQKGVCSPVELQVFELLKSKPRLYRFGSRTIFNHPLVSILVFNLKDGEVDTDIFIDALAALIECIGARMAFITYNQSLVTVQQQIKQAVVSTQKMLNISKLHQQEVMNEIVQNIGASFHVLDLDEKQETYLTDMVHRALKKHSQDDINFFEVSDFLDQASMKIDELKALNETTVVLPILSDDQDGLFNDEDDILF
jgi:ActR/RegA family two-component response regulator